MIKNRRTTIPVAKVLPPKSLRNFVISGFIASEMRRIKMIVRRIGESVGKFAITTYKIAARKTAG